MTTQVRSRARSEATAWRELLVRSGVAVVALLAVAAAGLRDVEAAAFALGGLGALALLRFRSGLLGAIGLGIISADVASFMALGAFSNLRHGQGLWETGLPAALTVASVLTFTAAVATVTRRGGGRTLAAVQAGAIGVLALVLVLAALGVGETPRTQAGDISLVTERVAFSETEITAPAGRIGVFVSNKDLFWHTFTVEELGVDLRVPVGGDRRASFEAAPGTYRFVCAIPGHPQAGMEGTLIVR